MMVSPVGYVNAAEFGYKIDLTRKSVGDLIKRGVIDAQKEGRHYLIRLDAAIDKLMKIGKLDEHGKYLRDSDKHKIIAEEDEPVDVLFGDDVPVTDVSPLNDAEKKRIVSEQKKNPPVKASVEIDDSFIDDLDDDTVNMYLSAQEVPDDLRALLDDAATSKDKAQIVNYYWTGKKNRLQYEKEKRNLIEMNEAKGVIEKLFMPIDKKLNDLPIDLKNRFPNIHPDAIEYLSDSINNMKLSLQEYQWEN